MSQWASLQAPPGPPSAIAGQPSQLADTVESLKAAMEIWRSDLARAGAQAEERLLRVLEVLESRVAQNQAMTTEIKELQSNSASWLTRAMEEWKSEVRQGAGLSEVRVLSAIESVALRIAELQDSETQSLKQLERRSTDIGRNLEASIETRIDTLKSAQDETRALLDTSAKSIGSDAKTALGRLSDLSAAVATSEESAKTGLASINTSFEEWKSAVTEWRAAVAESAGKTEARLLRALEALEGSITRSGEATTAAHDRAERNHGELSGAVRDMRASLEALTERSNAALRESVASGLGSLEGNVLMAVDSKLAPINTAVTSPRLEELLLTRLEDLETKLSSTLQEATTSDQALTERTINDLRERLSRAFGLLEDNMLKTVDSKLAPITTAVTSTRVEERLLSRLEDLEKKLSSVHENSEDRLDRMDNSIRALADTVDDWRTKGRQAANRNKERISLSLDTLEKRILDNREEDADHRETIRGELAALTDAIDDLRADGRDFSSIMRGLEELDEGLLRNRDDLASLSVTLEGQFEMLEARVSDIFERRLDDLEHRFQDRLRNVGRATRGNAESATFGSLDDSEGRRAFSELEEGPDDASATERFRRRR